MFLFNFQNPEFFVRFCSISKYSVIFNVFVQFPNIVFFMFLFNFPNSIFFNVFVQFPNILSSLMFLFNFPNSVFFIFFFNFQNGLF